MNNAAHTLKAICTNQVCWHCVVGSFSSASVMLKKTEWMEENLFQTARTPEQISPGEGATNWGGLVLQVTEMGIHDNFNISDHSRSTIKFGI